LVCDSIDAQQGVGTDFLAAYSGDDGRLTLQREKSDVHLGRAETQRTVNFWPNFADPAVSITINLESPARASIYAAGRLFLGNNHQEKPCVSFYKEPLGTGCQPSITSAGIARSAVLRIQFTCPSDRRPYVGWFCPNCSDSDLQSGYSGNFSHTANAHFIHAYQPGRYHLSIICSEPGTAGGFGGKQFDVAIEK